MRVALNMEGIKMNNYKWSITNIVYDGVLKEATYYVVATNETTDLLVETQGNWYFNGNIEKTFMDIQESDIIELIRAESVTDGINVIEHRLDQQLEYISNTKPKTIVPWLPQVFVPTI